MTGWLIVAGSLAAAAGVNAVFAVARRRRRRRWAGEQATQNL